jgi:hypothetical protein
VAHTFHSMKVGLASRAPNLTRRHQREEFGDATRARKPQGPQLALADWGTLSYSKLAKA